MEFHSEKKKNRTGKKSLENFKARCRLRKEEKKKQKQLEKSMRDEEKRLLAEQKKAKYNRMIARMHEEIENKEFVRLQKKAERKSLQQVESEREEIKKILADESRLFDEARASAKKRHEASEQLKKRDREYRASLANRNAYIKESKKNEITQENKLEKSSVNLQSVEANQGNCSKHSGLSTKSKSSIKITKI